MTEVEDVLVDNEDYGQVGNEEETATKNNISFTNDAFLEHRTGINDATRH